MPKNKTEESQKHKHFHEPESVDFLVMRLKNNKKKHYIHLLFNMFAKKVSDVVGHEFTFFLAVAIIIAWAIIGPIFHFSDTWQLVINTATTIITFLMVFLIQNTQNRDTAILNIKLDELIRSIREAKNPLIDLSQLSDTELKELEQEYCRLRDKKTGR